MCKMTFQSFYSEALPNQYPTLTEQGGINTKDLNSHKAAQLNSLLSSTMLTEHTAPTTSQVMTIMCLAKLIAHGQIQPGRRQNT